MDVSNILFYHGMDGVVKLMVNNLLCGVQRFNSEVAYLCYFKILVLWSVDSMFAKDASCMHFKFAIHSSFYEWYTCTNNAGTVSCSTMHLVPTCCFGRCLVVECFFGESH